MRNETRKSNKYESLERKYRLKTKGIKTVIEELKQPLKAKSAKIRMCFIMLTRREYLRNLMVKFQVKEPFLMRKKVANVGVNFGEMRKSIAERQLG